MKQLILLSSFLMLMAFGCEKNYNFETDTPKSLEEKNYKYQGYSSKGDRGDIIERMYVEAMANNADLKDLDNKIEAINGMKNDSMHAYRMFVSKHEDYWSTVDRYINRIKDTTLAKAVTAYFDKYQTEYNAMIEPLQKVENNIKDREEELNNQHLVMKLMVTAPMMQRYMNNEFPSVATLKRIQTEFESLIAKSKKYTVIPQ